MKLTKKAKRKILAGLVEIKEKQKQHYGICNNLVSVLCGITHTELRLFFDEYFRKWPKYSGWELYPIPGGSAEYDTAQYENKLWSKRSKYGRLRWELLDFLIETLTKELDNEE